MEFKRRVLRFKMDDVEYQVRYPTVAQYNELRGKAKDSDQEDIGPTLDFLQTLGLPKEVSENMEPDHLKQVIDAITGSKKN